MVSDKKIHRAFKTHTTLFINKIQLEKIFSVFTIYQNCTLALTVQIQNTKFSFHVLAKRESPLSFKYNVQEWAEKFIGWLWCNGQIWPNVVIFQHNPPWSPHTSSIGVAALGLLWYRSSYPDPRKKSSTADMTSSSVRYCFPAKCFFMLGNRK